MDLSIIITEIEACADRTGLMPSTICQKALSNALYYERAKKRAQKVALDIEKLREFVRANATGDAA